MMLDSGHRQSGLTLVELMIALLIGSILLAGLISLFLATRQTQQTRQHLSEIAENARFFTEFIARDIRMAGYQSGDCAFNGSGLDWEESEKTLKIRYCRHGRSVHDYIKYRFGTDGNYVVKYSDDDTPLNDSSPRPQPLLNGLELKHIWFGEQKDGGLIYKADINPDFSKLRTVRLEFRLQGDIGVSQEPANNQVTPSFTFTVTLRNNTLEPLQNPKVAGDPQ